MKNIIHSSLIKGFQFNWHRFVSFLNFDQQASRAKFKLERNPCQSTDWKPYYQSSYRIKCMKAFAKECKNKV